MPDWSLYWRLTPDKQVVRCENLKQFQEMFDDDDARRVDSTELAGGNVRVSTVFLAIDHDLSFPRANAGSLGYQPLIFETMIFGGEHDGEQWRCRTWDEAVAQHAAALAIVLGVEGVQMPNTE